MARPFLTVVLMSNLNVPVGTTVPFGEGVVLSDVPEWLRRDRFLDGLGEVTRHWIADAQHAFLIQYESDALGEPDPRWKGSLPKSKQDLSYELAGLANLSLWLATPTPACMAHVFHCPDFGNGWMVQQASGGFTLLCHPNDAGNRLSVPDIETAATLHQPLARMHVSDGMWAPALLAINFLQTNSESLRYLLCWVGLESMFGPDDGREMSYRLAQRIGFFLGKDRAEARTLFQAAKEGYGLRSKLAHGRWKYDPKATPLMLTAEELFRNSLKKILGDARLLETFASKERETFLDSLAYT